MLNKIIKFRIQIVFLLLFFSTTINAQPSENNPPDDFKFGEQLDQVRIDPYEAPSSPSDFYWDIRWYAYDSDNTPRDNSTDYGSYNTGNTNNNSNSNGGGDGNASNKIVSQIILTKKVKAGQTHTQNVKVIRDSETSTEKKVIDLIVGETKVGTITFSEPQWDPKGVDIYTKMTVEVFSNFPGVITNITFDSTETSKYEGSQNSTNGNLQEVFAQVSNYEGYEDVSFRMSMNEEEDLIIETIGDSHFETPLSYENKLNEAGKGDFKIVYGVVKIKADDGTYVLASNADVTSSSVLKRVKNLAAIITKSLGGGGNEIYIDTEKGNKKSKDNQAWTRKIGGTTYVTIFLNINGGFSTDLNNIYNFKSIIKHEMFHVEDFKDLNLKLDPSTHADVYIKAANDVTYSATTDDFKMGNAGSFAKYLLNMAKREDFTLHDILAKINAFNKNNGGVKVLVPGTTTKATLTLRVQYKNIISEPIEYEKIDE